MADVAEQVLTNRAEIEKAIRNFWCSCGSEEMAKFLSRNQVEVKKGWKGPQLRDAIREFLRTRTDRQLVFVADETRPRWNEVPEPVWGADTPAEIQARKTPLIIVRQAPTGGVSTAVWLSGVEGDDSEGRTQYSPDDFAGIGRGPEALQELRGVVHGWLRQHPGARIESDISDELLELDKLDTKEPTGTPIPQPPAPEATEEPLTMPGLGSGSGTLVKLRPDEIRVVSNPRKQFDETDLQELAASIRTYGVLQPLVVNRVHGHHDLIAGERRLRAAVMARLPLVPCIVLQVTPKEAAELRLLENIQRRDLTPLEEADAFAELVQNHGYTQEQLAEKLGKSTGWVSERLALRELPEAVRAAVARGDLAIRSALALKPYMQPGHKPAEAVEQVAKEMAERRPPAAEVANWVRREMYQASRSLQPADAEQHLRNYSADERQPPRDRVFPLDQVVEGVTAPPCTECPRRMDLELPWRQDKVPCCLQPSCWGAKQAKVWRKVVREHKALQAEQERQKQERLAAQVERAVEREAKAAGTSTAPVDQLTQVAIRVQQIARAAKDKFGPYTDLRAWTKDELEPVVREIGFTSLEELEQGLAAGQGAVFPGDLQPAELARRMTQLLARKAAGEDITKPVVTEQTGGKQKPRLATAPPLPDADADLAGELRKLAREHWADQGAGEYEREAFLPLDALVEHWQAREALGASAMPKQMGETLLIHIPEFSVWIKSFGYREDDTGLKVDGGQVRVACSGGYTTQALPDGMVYFRARVAGTGAHKSLVQMLAMRCPGNPARHLVVTGHATVMIRRDLLPKWHTLMNGLPAVPDAVAAGR